LPMQLLNVIYARVLFRHPTDREGHVAIARWCSRQICSHRGGHSWKSCAFPPAPRTRKHRRHPIGIASQSNGPGVFPACAPNTQTGLGETRGATSTHAKPFCFVLFCFVLLSWVQGALHALTRQSRHGPAQAMQECGSMIATAIAPAVARHTVHRTQKTTAHGRRIQRAVFFSCVRCCRTLSPDSPLEQLQTGAPAVAITGHILRIRCCVPPSPMRAGHSTGCGMTPSALLPKWGGRDCFCSPTPPVSTGSSFQASAARI